MSGDLINQPELYESPALTEDEKDELRTHLPRVTQTDLEGQESLTIVNGKTLDYLLNQEKSIALGLISGMSVVRNVGFNRDVGATQQEDIISFGGLYPFLDNAEFLEVSSDDVNDTLLGTGARIIRIEGLLDDYTEVVELVELEGTTVVTTDNQFLRVNSVLVVSVGTTGFNEGIVSLISAATGQTQAEVVDDSQGTGLNRSFQNIYTVPAGKTVLLKQATATITKSTGGSGVKEGAITISVRDFTTKVFIPFGFTATRSDGTSFVVVKIVPEAVAREKSDIRGVALGLTNANRFAMSISMILIDNETYGLT